MKCSYSRITLTLLLTLMTYVAAFAQDVPPDAIAVAQDYLEWAISKASSDEPRYFEEKWHSLAPIKLDKIVLEKPYIIFLMNEEGIGNYADSKNTDLLCCLKLRNYVFPVFSDGEFIGAIKVAKAVDKKAWGVRGEWCIDGWYYGDSSFDPWLLRVRDAYAKQDGYIVSQMITAGIGQFLIVQHKGTIIEIAPTGLGGVMTLSLTSTSDGEYPFMDFAAAAPLLKDAAIQHKMHQIEFLKRLEREQGQPPR